MIATEKPKKLAAQKCPLCGNFQDIIINGWEPSKEEGKKGFVVVEDQGYSFCNCNNIHFTDWKNINQGTYDPDYYKKYDSPAINSAMRVMASRFIPTIFENLPLSTVEPKVLDVGSINPTILDVFKEFGFQTTGLDIHDHPLGQHKLVVGNFENMILPETYDVIWASHVFEHFKDPIAAVKYAHNCLNENGIIFVAMPDPWFIDFSNPYAWGHWHLREHHILWDMDSFAAVLEDQGFEIISKKRNTNLDQVCVLDYQIIARKKSYREMKSVVNNESL